MDEDEKRQIAYGRWSEARLEALEDFSDSTELAETPGLPGPGTSDKNDER